MRQYQGVITSSELSNLIADNVVDFMNSLNLNK